MNEESLLYQFFGGYFNQDWDLDAASPEEVVLDFKRESDPKEVQELAQSILRYADKFKNDADLDNALFKELDCYYSPSLKGQSAKSWLIGISEMLLSEREPD